MAKGEKHNNVSSGLQNTRINKQHIFSFIGGGNRKIQLIQLSYDHVHDGPMRDMNKNVDIKFSAHDAFMK